MKKVNEGPLDAINGAIGAKQSKSPNANTAASGKRKLKKAAAKRFASSAGQNRRKVKMVQAMLTAWNDTESKIIMKGGESDISDFNSWFSGFMAPRAVEPMVLPFNDNTIKKYITSNVNKYYGKSPDKPSQQNKKEIDPRFDQDDTEVKVQQRARKDHRRADAGLDGAEMKASGTDAGLKNIKLKSQINKLRKRAAATTNSSMIAKINNRIERMKQNLVAESLSNDLMSDYLSEGKLLDK